jgi:hypothetical protein
VHAICPSGVSTRILRFAAGKSERVELCVRLRVKPHDLIQRPQWMNGCARTFPGCEIDARTICAAWNAECRSQNEGHRFRVLDIGVQREWSSNESFGAQLIATTETMRILKHEKSYVSEMHDLTRSRGGIRSQIWSLAVGQDCLVNCDRKTAYKLTEAERLRHRDRTRRFRFKTVETDEGPRVRVLRMVDDVLYNLASWQVGECREFTGHTRNRWYVMSRLNREFAKGQPNAQIYEVAGYTENTFTIERIR